MTSTRPGRAPTLPPAAGRLGTRLIRRFVLTEDRSWAEQRARLDRTTANAILPPGTAVESLELGGVPVERIRAGGAIGADDEGRDDPCDGPCDGPVVIHLHGGGYCVGSPALLRSWAAALSEATGRPVLLPAYRLAPEFPFPAARTTCSPCGTPSPTDAGHPTRSASRATLRVGGSRCRPSSPCATPAVRRPVRWC